MPSPATTDRLIRSRIKPYSDSTASSTLTGFSNEVVLATMPFSPAALRFGDNWRIDTECTFDISTAAVTMQIRLRLGGLGGTLLWDSGAFDPSIDDQTGLLNLQLDVVTLGTSGLLHASGIFFPFVASTNVVTAADIRADGRTSPSADLTGESGTLDITGHISGVSILDIMTLQWVIFEFHGRGREAATP